MEPQTLLALITATAAAISPAIVAYITQRGAYRVKSAEWFFTEKVEAYKAFMEEIDNFLKNPSHTPDDLTALSIASSRALLFASTDAQGAIARYGAAIASASLHSATSANSAQLAHLQLEAITAMRSDVISFERPGLFSRFFGWLSKIFRKNHVNHRKSHDLPDNAHQLTFNDDSHKRKS